MEFLDPDGEITKHGLRLPHWQQSEAMQFVTFRLGDAMPQGMLRQWREEHTIWRRHHPQPWREEERREYHRRFTGRLEQWLDEGAGSCLFEDPAARQIVEDTLISDHGERAIHHAWVIMPNHVHLLFTPRERIEVLIKTWKGVSARRIGRGSIWQRGYRDTIIRNAEHFVNVVRYIRRNPARLGAGMFTLWQGERASEV